MTVLQAVGIAGAFRGQDAQRPIASSRSVWRAGAWVTQNAGRLDNVIEYGRRGQKSWNRNPSRSASKQLDDERDASSGASSRGARRR